MTKREIFYLFVLLTISVRVSAQGNTGFEQGSKGWMVSGDVAIDAINAHSGTRCVRIGKAPGSVMQRIEVTPLSIVSYNAYVKTSDSTVKAYSFIRFLDVNNHLILAYKSNTVKTQSYQQTGNYTETPAKTSWMEIGVERDSSKNGFVYADDFEIKKNIGVPKEKHQPLCSLDEYMRPFWKGDTIYNETVLLYSMNGQAAEGKLLYTPDKILSVKKFDLKSTFKPGADYTIAGKVITRSKNSAMPFRADTSFDTKKDLAWFNTESQWVVVTYTHHDRWDGPVPQYKGRMMPNTIAKLKAKAPLTIVAYGMSITRGMDVSGYDDVPPYMPTYVDLFARELRKKYRDKNIKLYNAGLPGSTVDWGAQYADQYVGALKPDLVIIDFGMNDFWRLTPALFKGYIATIISKIKKQNPKAEFILLSNMKFDPDYVLDSDKNKSFYLSNMEGYNQVLRQLATKGVINLDMTTLSEAIYHRKKAKDCIANPLHPNDYMARWYAQGLAQLLIK